MSSPILALFFKVIIHMHTRLTALDTGPLTITPQQYLMYVQGAYCFGISSVEGLGTSNSFNLTFIYFFSSWRRFHASFQYPL